MTKLGKWFLSQRQTAAGPATGLCNANIEIVWGLVWGWVTVEGSFIIVPVIAGHWGPPRPKLDCVFTLK